MRIPPAIIAFPFMLGVSIAAEGASPLDELTALSVGSFTTIGQAQRDERYGVAEAEIVRIWPERSDGVWTYQEQAFLGDGPKSLDQPMKNKPYFMRVIHSVETAPGVVRRTVHKLKDPRNAIGAWRGEAPLASMSPEDLEPGECTITATRIAEKMWESKSGDCPNAYKGATYALSLGVILEGRYANWDRGFDRNGAHVWGPPDGGYIFERKD